MPSSQNRTVPSAPVPPAAPQAPQGGISPLSPLATLPSLASHVMPIASLIQRPMDLGWPPMFPFELALGNATPQAVCAEYGIDSKTFSQWRKNPAFKKAVTQAEEMLKEDGLGFKTRARLQAGEVLKHAVHMIDDKTTPPQVVADLIKFIVRVAGLDASKDQGAGGIVGPNVQIVIDMGDK